MRDLEREVGYGITDSWDEIVEILQGALVSFDTELGGYTERQLLAGRLNMLFRDRRAHAYTRQLMETEARMRQTVISELLRMDHRRSIEISESRTALQGQITALQGQVTALQAQVATLQGQQGQQRLTGDPTQPELPEEAGGSA
nr:hypothetical protein [Tanacetum cinerariifolium]